MTTHQIQTSTPTPHRRQYNHMDSNESETRIPLPSPQPFRRSFSLRLRGSSSYHNELSSSLSKEEDTTDFSSFTSTSAKRDNFLTNNNKNYLNNNNIRKSSLNTSRSLQSFNTESTRNCCNQESHKCNGAPPCNSKHVVTSVDSSNKKLSPISPIDSNVVAAKSPTLNNRNHHGMVRKNEFFVSN